MGEPSITLRCDGAHTPLSIDACISWFREVTTKSSDDDDDDAHFISEKGGPMNVTRVLVFNCGHERNPIPLLYRLCMSDLFDSVYFCHADTERPSAVPKTLVDGWTREPLHFLNDDESEGTVTWEGMRESLPSSIPGDSLDYNDGSSGTTWQTTLGYLWSVMEAYHRRDDGPPRPVIMGLSVKDALTSIREMGLLAAIEDGVGDSVNAERRIEVCVTGSLYIVGSALAASGWKE